MAAQICRSRELGNKVGFAALQILRDKAGPVRGREIVAEVENRVQLDDWARERCPSTGQRRWEVAAHFSSTELYRAGLLIKNRGLWHITPAGDDALKLGQNALFRDLGQHSLASALPSSQ
jgi:restriction system protein